MSDDNDKDNDEIIDVYDVDGHVEAEIVKETDEEEKQKQNNPYFEKAADREKVIAPDPGPTVTEDEEGNKTIWTPHPQAEQEDPTVIKSDHDPDIDDPRREEPDEEEDEFDEEEEEESFTKDQYEKAANAWNAAAEAVDNIAPTDPKKEFARVLNELESKDDASPAETEAALADKWQKFIESFYVFEGSSDIGITNKVYPYFEQIKRMRSIIPIPGITPMGSTIFYFNFEDLQAASIKVPIETMQQELNKIHDLLVNNYAESIAAIKLAVYNILVNIQPDYAAFVKDRLIVSIHNSPQYSEISALTSEDIDKLKRVEGVITQFDNGRQIKILENSWECEAGHITPVEGGFKPKTCTQPIFDGRKSEECGARIIRERTDKQKRTDMCYIRIQQRQDKLREGRVDPVEIDIRYEGTELVQKILNEVYPGQYVTVDGVVRLLHLSQSDASTATIEIEGSSFIVMPESVLIEDDPDLEREVRKEIPPEEMVAHFHKMIRSIAPHLEGLEAEKTALLAQLAGADAKEKRGGARFRGDLNILIVGSPSTGKTEMLKFMSKIRPRSTYVIGRTASAVGLTAGIEQVEIMRGGQRVSTKRVSFGAYALARDGIVCLDEVEKRDKTDYEDLSHPMDDVQELNVSKAGIYKRISASCASLHAGNPTKNNGVYDRTQHFFAQINFAVWLFSRYDLIFILTDENSDAKRARLWNYISDSYAKVRLEKDIPSSIHHRETPGSSMWQRNKTKVPIDPKDDWYPWQHLRREIIYLRETYHPVLKPGYIAWDMMMKFWNRYNQVNLTPALDPEAKLDSNTFVPAVDKRKINGLIRVSEAIARLFRSNTVEPEHMDITINLFKYSIGSLIPEVGPGYANPELMRSHISRTMTDYASKEIRKGVMERVREYRHGLFKFTKWLHNMTWDACALCHGKKQMKFLTDESRKYYTYRPCTDCSGTGGQYRKFKYADINRLPKEAAIMAGDVGRYFNWLMRAGAVKSNGDLTFTVVTDLRDKKLFQVDSEIFIDDEGRADLEKYQQQEAVITPPRNASDRKMFDAAINDLKKIGGDDIY